MNKSYISSNDIEIRVGDGGKSIIISGFIPSNQLSHTLFDKKRKEFFREKIKDGAFSKSINEKNPSLLLNHNWKQELEVVSFDWSENSSGLRFEAEILPDEALIEAIDMDLINGLSFGFVVEKSGQSWARVNGELIRTINKFKELMEISIVYGKNNQPAYPKTIVFAGSSKKVLIEKEIHHLKQKINKLRLNDIEKHRKRQIDYMRSFIDSRR